MTGNGDLGSQMIAQVLESQSASNCNKLTHNVEGLNNIFDPQTSYSDQHKDVNCTGLERETKTTEFGSSRFCSNQPVHDSMNQSTNFDHFKIINMRDNHQKLAYSRLCPSLKSQHNQEFYSYGISSADSLTRQEVSTGEEKLFTIEMRGHELICLEIDGQRRLCLSQISATLLQQFSYNEIHNRRVALGITCVQCTPSQLELLREAGAMPTSSRRCGTITYREAERLVKSFLDEPDHPKLPENFAFHVVHHCGWGCRGTFAPSRYSSSRAKCIRCDICQAYFSPNKFIFHCHPPSTPDLAANQTYRHPDAANFNAWRRHLYLVDSKPSIELLYAWEDVKAMFNGGNRKRSVLSHSSNQSLEFQTEDSMHLDDNEEENDDADKQTYAYLKRPKLVTHRLTIRDQATYLDHPVRMNHDLTNYEPSNFDQFETDLNKKCQGFRSSRGEKFLIENVIGDNHCAMSSNPSKFMLPNKIHTDSDLGQMDPLNLSSNSHTSKSVFRKRCPNENQLLKYATSRECELINSDHVRNTLTNYSNFNDLSNEPIKISPSNIIHKTINPYDSPASLFPNLFTHPSLMNIVTNRNEVPNSMCSTLDNSWPLLFLNHVFHLMRTDNNQFAKTIAKQTILNADENNMGQSNLLWHHSTTPFSTKLNSWASHFQNTDKSDHNVFNCDTKSDFISSINFNDLVVRSTESYQS